jgi:hypothetical protein
MPDSHENLERMVHRALRELPSRRAPASLENRVLAQLAARAARPWWRKGFVHWPVPARAGFIVISAGIVKLVLMAAVWVMAGFDTAEFRAAFSEPVTWLENALAVVRGVTGFFEIIFRNIPPLWLYGGVAFIATMYVALFGLGAAAYKALHVRR